MPKRSPPTTPRSRPRPSTPARWLNRGKALAQLNRLDEAIASYGKALALRKDDADAHFNAALALLTLGDYRRGFEEYEWRWRRTGMPPQKSRGRPLWLGEYPLARKTILLHAEQGLGDTIQFARYVPLVAASGAKVVLEVQPELKPLMARLDGAATVIARGEAPPPFDVHCPLGSLPLALQDGAGDGAGANSLSRRPTTAQLAKWSARIGALAAAAHRARLVGQSEPRQRSQPLDRRSQSSRRCSPLPARASSASSATCAPTMPRRSPPKRA